MSIVSISLYIQVFSCIEMFHPIGFAFLLVLTLSIQAEIFSQQCPYLKMKMNERKLTTRRNFNKNTEF